MKVASFTTILTLVAIALSLALINCGGDEEVVEENPQSSNEPNTEELAKNETPNFGVQEAKDADSIEIDISKLPDVSGKGWYYKLYNHEGPEAKFWTDSSNEPIAGSKRFRTVSGYSLLIASSVPATKYLGPPDIDGDGSTDDEYRELTSWDVVRGRPLGAVFFSQFASGSLDTLQTVLSVLQPSSIGFVGCSLFEATHFDFSDSSESAPRTVTLPNSTRYIYVGGALRYQNSQDSGNEQLVEVIPCAVRCRISPSHPVGIGLSYLDLSTCTLSNSNGFERVERDLEIVDCSNVGEFLRSLPVLNARRLHLKYILGFPEGQRLDSNTETSDIEAGKAMSDALVGLSESQFEVQQLEIIPFGVKIDASQAELIKNCRFKSLYVTNKKMISEEAVSLLAGSGINVNFAVGK